MEAMILHNATTANDLCKREDDKELIAWITPVVISGLGSSNLHDFED